MHCFGHLPPASHSIVVFPWGSSRTTTRCWDVHNQRFESKHIFVGLRCKAWTLQHHRFLANAQKLVTKIFSEDWQWQRKWLCWEGPFKFNSNQDIDLPIFSHIFLILGVISTVPFLRDDRGSNRVSLGRWRLARQGSVHAVITLTAGPWTSKLAFIS